jgi:formylglycine-generating enzyme required for sulfatase activity
MKIKLLPVLTAILIVVLLLLVSCGSKNNPVNNGVFQITSLLPSEAYISQAVTIIGTDFGDTRSGSYVSLNGVKLDDSCHYSWSNTQVVFFVPAGDVTGDVTLTVNGVISNAKPLTIDAQPASDAPFIDYLSQDIAQPRQTISIYGKNFRDTPKGYVEFNGLRTDDISFWGDGRVSVKVPDNAISGKVVVFLSSGEGTNGVYFKVQTTNQLVEMVRVVPDTFTMGSDSPVLTNDFDCNPAHLVKITKPFWIGKYEVTQKQFKIIRSGWNPSRDTGDSKPVQNISWLEAVNTCNELSKMENYDTCYTINGNNVTCDFSKNGYRLPTEAEWEFACRAGTTGLYAGLLDTLGWDNDNAGNKIHDVGTLKGNAWGIYDMHGNVWEWCWDYFDASYYSGRPNPDIDPIGPSTSDTQERVYRGGSYIDGSIYSASAARQSSSITSANFDLGFRVVRNAK